VAAVAFAVIVCAVFVGLTRLAVAAPFPVLDAVVVGLAFFVLPCLLVSAPAAVLWMLCLYGGWSMGDSARLRRLRLESMQVPDGVPEDWRRR
jgi:hypothetical protein